MTIGVFDSGVGGLWILKHIREAYPDYDYIYMADQANVPYGPRSMEEIRNFSEEITKFLISKGCQLIVIACNTASAAALKYLRTKYPEILFIGMEPALKPAIENSQTGKVGVLATPATLQGEFYSSLVEKFGNQAELFENTCFGLVEQIEKGEFETEETKNILEQAINPMIDKNIDTLVLGCTHYPFVTEEIKKITENKIKIIDPTSAIVRRVGQVLEENGRSCLPAEGKTFPQGKLDIFTSGEINKIETFLSEVLKQKIKVQKYETN